MIFRSPIETIQPEYTTFVEAHSLYRVMLKQLLFFSLLSFFSVQSLFSQVHLLKAEQHGYDFSWRFMRHCGDFPCESLGWDNTLSFGYAHGGRFHVSLAWYAENGFTGDIITPTGHHVDTEITFAILKEGINGASFTLTSIAGGRYGGERYYKEKSLRVGIGLFKRIEKSKTFSINPGIRALYVRNLEGAYGYGGLILRASTDFLFNRFKIGPYLSLGENGASLGLGMGFVLPSYIR